MNPGTPSTQQQSLPQQLQQPQQQVQQPLQPQQYNPNVNVAALQQLQSQMQGAGMSMSNIAAYNFMQMPLGNGYTPSQWTNGMAGQGRGAGLPGQVPGGVNGLGRGMGMGRGGVGR